MNEPQDKNVLADRAELGLSKYGVTTERLDLSRIEWLKHAQAEALDLAVYLQRLISDEERAMKPCGHEFKERDLSNSWFCKTCRQPLKLFGKQWLEIKQA